MSFDMTKQHKILAAVCLGLVAIVAVTAVIIISLTPKKTPVSDEYIAVTIDDSVSASFTLALDDYSVLSAGTYDKANSYLVNGIGMNISFTQAMDLFVKQMIDAKKITGKDNEVLLFSVESRNEQDFEKLSSLFKDVLKEHSCSSRVYTLYIKVKQDNIQDLADKHSVSYSKAHLCMKLQKENSKLKAEELIDLSVTEIVELVNRIAKEDLVSKVESETNKEQAEEEIPKQDNSSVTSSNGSSSEISSSENTSSDNTSSDNTSSDTSSNSSSSSGTNSSSGPSFTVSKDEGWYPNI